MPGASLTAPQFRDFCFVIVDVIVIDYQFAEFFVHVHVHDHAKIPRIVRILWSQGPIFKSGDQ